MPKGINKTNLVGVLTTNPKAIPLPDDKAMVQFIVNTGDAEQDDSNECHRIIALDELADIAKQYLQKGAEIYIEGKLKTQKWQDCEEITQQAIVIVAKKLIVLDSDQMPITTPIFSKYTRPPKNTTSKTPVVNNAYKPWINQEIEF